MNLLCLFLPATDLLQTVCCSTHSQEVQGGGGVPTHRHTWMLHTSVAVKVQELKKVFEGTSYQGQQFSQVGFPLRWKVP